MFEYSAALCKESRVTSQLSTFRHKAFSRDSEGILHGKRPSLLPCLSKCSLGSTPAAATSGDCLRYHSGSKYSFFVIFKTSYLLGTLAMSLNYLKFLLLPIH